MTKSEFWARAASNAPSVPAHYQPDFPAFVRPVKGENENDLFYRSRVSREMMKHQAEKQKARLESWPLAYASKLADDMEAETPGIFTQ